MLTEQPYMGKLAFLADNDTIKCGPAYTTGFPPTLVGHAVVRCGTDNLTVRLAKPGEAAYGCLVRGFVDGVVHVQPYGTTPPPLAPGWHHQPGEPERFVFEAMVLRSIDWDGQAIIELSAKREWKGSVAVIRWRSLDGVTDADGSGAARKRVRVSMEVLE